MPAYDYRCNACRRRVTLTYKTYAEYDHAQPVCSFCGSTNLMRTIGRIGIAKSESRRFSDLDSDDSALDDLADADPATLGRYMRRMSDETGEDLGEEFNEVVERLEHGESPESIEESVGLPDDSGMGGMDSDFSAGGMGDIGDDF